jgi:hypothetical protein
MTGLKNIENQRAFEAAHERAKEEVSYKLLEEIFEKGYLNSVPGAAALQERVRVYLATGILNGQYTPPEEVTA